MLAIQTILLTILGVLLAIDVHECCHAWAADRLGDPTGRYMGRITLNPVKHLDPLGTVMILFSSIAGFGIGWGKPMPVNPFRLRYGPRVGMALVAFAGPAANLVTAMILALPLRLGLDMPHTLRWILINLAYINVILAVFNLIPLPPLDGYSVLMGILSSVKSQSMRQVTDFLSRLERQGPILLLALLSIGWVTRFNVLGAIIGPPIRLLWKLIGG